MWHKEFQIKILPISYLLFEKFIYVLDWILNSVNISGENTESSIDIVILYFIYISHISLNRQIFF